MLCLVKTHGGINGVLELTSVQVFSGKTFYWLTINPFLMSTESKNPGNLNNIYYDKPT